MIRRDLLKMLAAGAAMVAGIKLPALSGLARPPGPQDTVIYPLGYSVTEITFPVARPVKWSVIQSKMGW